MKVWFCKRGEEAWTGGLIIAAPTKEKAVEIFEDYEHDQVHEVIELDLSKEGVLHDDWER